jgi:hypothetical protein
MSTHTHIQTDTNEESKGKNIYTSFQITRNHVNSNPNPKPDSPTETLKFIESYIPTLPIPKPGRTKMPKPQPTNNYNWEATKTNSSPFVRYLDENVAFR